MLIRIRPRRRGQTANRGLHFEMGSVWSDVAADPAVNVAVLTGAGSSFMPSVDVDAQAADLGQHAVATGLMKEGLAIVRGIVDCHKPIVSAINGQVGGAGLAAAVLADISVAGNDVQLIEAHMRFGLPAGDRTAVSMTRSTASAAKNHEVSVPVRDLRWAHGRGVRP